MNSLSKIFWQSAFCGILLLEFCVNCLGGSLDETIAIMDNSAMSIEERANAGGQIAQSLVNQNGPIRVSVRDHDIIARSSVALLDEKETAIQEIGVYLLLSIPPSKFDESALEKLVTNAPNPSLAIRLVAGKGLASSTAALVIKTALSSRPDTFSFQLATTEALKRKIPGLKDNLIAALADNRTGVRSAAAQALVELPPGNELSGETLRKYLSEAETRMKQHEELEKYLPQTGASSPPTDEQLLIAALRSLLQTISTNSQGASESEMPPTNVSKKSKGSSESNADAEVESPEKLRPSTPNDSTDFIATKSALFPLWLLACSFAILVLVLATWLKFRKSKPTT